MGQPSSCKRTRQLSAMLQQAAHSTQLDQAHQLQHQHQQHARCMQHADHPLLPWRLLLLLLLSRLLILLLPCLLLLLRLWRVQDAGACGGGRLCDAAAPGALLLHRGPGRGLPVSGLGRLERGQAQARCLKQQWEGGWARPGPRCT